MEFPIHGGPWVVCVHCNTALNIPDGFAEEYFHAAERRCPKCDRPINWWEAILHTVRETFMNIQAFSPIGARWTALVVILRPDQRTQLRFSDHGIPADARILSLNYTPQAGGLFPIEIHGNVPQRHLIPPALNLYPMPVGDEPHNDTRVAVLVTWVPNSPDNEAWQNLVDAFEAYALGRYQSAVVPANVAVESTLTRLITDFLERTAPRDQVESFLREGATYSYQLNVLLPALLGFTDAPELPNHVRGKLNRLRSLRHQMAHRGIIDPPLQKGDIAECLCAAVFGFHYLHVIWPILLQ